MLKRAYISAVIAAIAAIFGFSGLLHGAAPIARGICYAFAAFCCLSLLFSLFEDVNETVGEELAPIPDEPAPQLLFDFTENQPALRPISP